MLTPLMVDPVNGEDEDGGVGLSRQRFRLKLGS